MLYASRDGDGERVLWTRRPRWDQSDEMWSVSVSPASDERYCFPERDLWVGDLVHAIFPKGLKPGDCVKVGRLSVVRRIEKEKRNVMGE